MEKWGVQKPLSVKKRVQNPLSVKWRVQNPFSVKEWRLRFSGHILLKIPTSSTASTTRHWMILQAKKLVVKEVQNITPVRQQGNEIYAGNNKMIGIYIEDFHNNWLFPLQERGMNNQAKELTKKEIEAFLEDETAKKRLVKSYKLMLDFYGIQLSNDTTGEVQRANNWRNRFDNMDRHTHNNLRITRILKCLVTLGFPHYQAPLVHFFLEETLVKGNLYNVKESVLNYFIFAVRDKQQRRELVNYAYKNYEPKHEFVWCPKKIQNIF
ncbi:opioid growth factor receptor-like isoform X2 [Salmo salar]|uniref:Opioid growth factor receptor-like isoform X2 n=1 Tax=Salmo salar TaxID=8030 RepID=A0ABM3CMG6_SALSA|nr:opioid growth factor receptor-like isoform X2 [Salmo salar]